MKTKAFTVRLPSSILGVLDQAAEFYGFSRSNFIAHLVACYQDYFTISEEGKKFLRAFMHFGYTAFQSGRPDIKVVASFVKIPEENIRDIVDDFRWKEWMEKRTTLTKNFNFDLEINGEVYGLTKTGMTIAGFLR